MLYYCCIFNYKMITLISILFMTILIKSSKSEPPAKYGPPEYQQSSYGDDHDHHHYDDHYDNHEPKSYEFGYAVKDDYSGNDYGRKETSDGNAVHGEYRVNLPDGRVQIVTYYADWKSGFHADVRYEGEAHYPEVYNKYSYGPPQSQQYGPPQSGGY
ncbi:pro-resilin-like [Chrysoperla carnea]|uniref:pro-resilin-like n=1 Tax=Chrysoperla carnea TaxID=189513 RepID=UPI001D067E86|nr:pro-resilin-like [Chrysoperla carnea]